MVAALDSIVDSINETVRKYCVEDSTTATSLSQPAMSAAVSTFTADEPTARRLHLDVSASPSSGDVLEHRSTPPSSAVKTSRMSGSDAGEISFADVARGMLTPPSSNHHLVIVDKPTSVDAGVQVSPMDFVDAAEAGHADVGVQVGTDDIPATGDGGGRCCPYCHSQLPASDATSAKESEMHSSAVSSVPSVDNAMHMMTSLSECVVVSSSMPTVTSPVSLPVQCSLSLGDSFHYSPLRNCSMSTAPVTVFPPVTSSGSSHSEDELPVSAAVASVCQLPMNTSLNDGGQGPVDAQDVQDGSPMHSDGMTSLSVAQLQSVSESSLINTPVVAFSVTPEAARLPTLADSGGQLSNTSLSNITLSDLLPSMQGSIPLELLVNQTDGFTMYTEIVPVSEPCHTDPLPSMDLPESETGCAVSEVLDAVVAHESWSPAPEQSQLSPVNMMVCLPISSVSSPSLSSFLSQHKSLSSFAGEAAVSRPPSPGTSAPCDAMETVAVAMVPSFDVVVPKSTVNYSIHRIVEASALKQSAAAAAADSSWSPSNSGVLTSRHDIPTNSATAVFSSSIAEEDNGGQPPNSSYHGDNNGCHIDHIHGNDSCRGDDSDTHDDICVIDSDRDVIVIDGDDEILRPHGSDPAAATTIPERTQRVGRHGRHRRRQATDFSSSDRLSRRLAANSATTAEVGNNDRSTSVNCLDNGFVEMSPSVDVGQIPQPETDVQVSLSFQILFNNNNNNDNNKN